jgi:hypothetical protein
MGSYGNRRSAQKAIARVNIIVQPPGPVVFDKSSRVVNKQDETRRFAQKRELESVPQYSHQGRAQLVDVCWLHVLQSQVY